MENWPNKNQQPKSKIDEYVDRVKAGETIESFGDIPESWKNQILERASESPSVEEEIEQIFNHLTEGAREGLKNNFEEKISSYIDRIHQGESKEYVLQGLGPSFVNAVESRLQKEDKSYSSIEQETGLDYLVDYNQTEFAQWLQTNKTTLENLTKKITNISGKEVVVNPIGNNISYYNLLTLRPELRAEALNTLNVNIRNPDFEDAREYFQITRAEEEKYRNSDSNPDWLQFNFGDTRNTEEDGMRRKGYITVDTTDIESFKENIPIIIQELNNFLPGNYNGSFKITQKLSTLMNQFDNLVIHGANEQEVENGLRIISDVLEKNGVKNKIAQKGKDGFDKKGQKTSHTRLLEEKIKNNEL